MDTMTPQIIDMYSKLLRVPTFRNYEDVIQRHDKDAGYADFLAELMKQEYDNRQESARLRNIKAARFPYLKTFDNMNSDHPYREEYAAVTKSSDKGGQLIRWRDGQLFH